MGQGELPTPSQGRLQTTDVGKECGLQNDTGHHRTLISREASGQRFSNFLITGRNSSNLLRTPKSFYLDGLYRMTFTGLEVTTEAFKNIYLGAPDWFGG